MTNQSPTESQEQQETVIFDSKIELVKNKYYFHEVIHQGDHDTHYIVEDLEVSIVDEPNMQQNIFFYLKHSKFSTMKDLTTAKKFYQKLIEYCVAPFSKSDIITYIKLWDYANQEDNVYELVVVSEFGESGRIDVENISNDHIVKFIKNLCVLLQDMKKYKEIYHNNIWLHNIVLDNDELKLSGFNPCLLSTQLPGTWKRDFLDKHDHFKLDIFMIGLLWLRFLGKDVDQFRNSEISLKEIETKIKEFTLELADDQMNEILYLLVDLGQYHQLTLEKIILLFEQNILVETYEFKREKNLFAQTLQSEDQDQETTKQIGGNQVDHIVNVVGGNFTLQGESEGQQNSKFTTQQNSQINQSQDPQNMQKLENMRRISQGNNHFKTVNSIEQINPDFQGEEMYMSSKYEDQLQEDARDMTIQQYQINPLMVENSEQQYTQSGKGLDYQQSIQETENQGNSQEGIKKSGNQDNYQEIVQRSRNQDDYQEAEQKGVNQDNEEYVKITKQRVKDSMQKFKQKSPNKKKKPKMFRYRFKKKQKSQEVKVEKVEEGEEPKYVFGELVKKEPEKNEELEQMIEEEIQRKKREMIEKQRAKEEILRKKREEQIQKEREIQEKIKRLAQAKRKQRKGERRSNKNEEKVLMKKKPRVPRQVKKKKFQFQNNKPKQKQPKVPEDFGISHYTDRAKFFEYNTQDYKNKGIPFKQIFQKYQISEEFPEKPQKKNFSPNIIENLEKIEKLPEKTKREEKEEKEKNNEQEEDQIYHEVETNQKLDDIEGEQQLNSNDRKIAYPSLDKKFTKDQLSQEEVEEEDIVKNQTRELIYQDFQRNIKPSVEDLQKNISEDSETLQEEEEDEFYIQETDDKIQREVMEQEENGSDEEFIVLEEELSKGQIQHQDINKIDIDKYLDSPDQEVAIRILKGLKDGETPQNKIEICKGLSILYFQKQDYEKSNDYLLESLQLLDNESMIPEDEEKKVKIIFSLAINNLMQGNYKNSLSLLQEIKDSPFKPKHFDKVEMDLRMKEGDNKKSFDFLVRKFHILTNQNMNEVDNQEKLVDLLIKILDIIKDFKEQQMVQFVNYLLNKLEEIMIRVKDKVGFHKLKVNFLMQLINMLFLNRMYNLINFFLNLISNEKIISLEYLSQNQYFNLAKIYLQFSLYLKSIKDYGNQKESFLSFLNYSLMLLDQIQIKNFQLSQKIVEVYLFKGIFFLQQKAFDLAKKNILAAYDYLVEEGKNNFQSPLIFMVLFNLGISYYQTNELKESLYYFEQLLDKQCEDPLIVERTKKQLLKLYFRLGLNERAFEKLQGWIKEKLMEENQENFTYLSMYFLMIRSLNVEESEQIIDQLKQQLETTPQLRNQQYLQLMVNISDELKIKKKYSQEQDIIKIILNILEIQGEDSGRKFLVEIKKLMNLFNQGKNREVFDLGMKLLGEVEKGKNSVKENSQQIENYLYNCLILSLANLDSQDESITNELRNQLILKIKNFKESHNIQDKIREVIFDENFENSLHSESVQSVKSIQSSTRDIEKIQNDFHESYIDKNIVKQKENQTEKVVKRFKKKPKLNPINVLQRKNYVLSSSFQDKKLIIQVDNFIDQLRKQGILQNDQKKKDILIKFNQNLSYLSLSLNAFAYIKKLTKKVIPQNKYLPTCKQILLTKDLSLKDIENIIILSENYQKPAFLKYFLKYLDRQHPQICQYVVQHMIHQQFLKKFETTCENLMNSIQIKEYRLMDNFSFFFELENFEILKKEQNYEFLIAHHLRYELLYQQDLNEIFSKYLTMDELTNFYYSYCIHEAILMRVQQSFSSVEILQNFMNNLIEINLEYKQKEIHYDYFPYYFYIICKIINIKVNTKKVADYIVQILHILKDKLPKKEQFHFSRVCSLIGNLLFRQKMFDFSVQCKQLAYETFKKHHSTPFKYPIWIQPTQPQNLFREILLFMAMNKIYLNELENAQQFLRKLLEMKIDNTKLKIENCIAQVVFKLHSFDEDQISELMALVDKKLGKIKEGFYKRLTMAILESLKYKFSILKTDKKQSIQMKKKSLVMVQKVKDLLK